MGQNDGEIDLILICFFQADEQGMAQLPSIAHLSSVGEKWILISDVSISSNQYSMSATGICRWIMPFLTYFEARSIAQTTTYQHFHTTV